MRGIFALWVVGFHLTVWSPIELPEIPFVSRGYLAVDFFFMLSGYILGLAHGNEFQGRPSEWWKAYHRFLAKRISRIFPLHWVVLASVIAVLWMINVPLYWRGYIVEEALLMHRWGIHAPKGAINGPDWSISAELGVNLFFPVIVYLAWRGTKIVTLGVTILSAIAIIHVARSHSWSLDVGMANSLLPLIRCGAEFTLGLISARFPRKLPSRRADYILWPTLLIFIALLIVRRSDVIIVAFMFPAIWVLGSNAGYFATALGGTVFKWLGDISYSVYLVQLPIIEVDREVASAIREPILSESFYIITSLILILMISNYPGKWIEYYGKKIGRSLLLPTKSAFQR